MPADLLSASTVGDHLVRRGIAGAGEPLAAVPLGGGVSNVVLGVSVGDREIVVKQSLPRLRVAEEWLADRERALTEAAALRLAGDLTPGGVPRVVDVDGGACALVLERAPSTWATWKDELLAGRIVSDVAARIGWLTGRWHAGTTAAPALTARFDVPEAFRQLRVDPYYRTVAARCPDVAARVSALADDLLARRTCLVHGDLSPKNVLVGDDAVWVIDFEVAHLGDPAFDHAFLKSHLLLKALRRPEHADALRACTDAFAAGYETSGAVAPPQDRVHAHTGCLLLARVDGKSPVEYLDDDAADAARRLGRALIDGAGDPWAILEEAA